MKTYDECLKCFERQAKDACRISHISVEQTRYLLQKVRKKIKTFSRSHPPVEMAAELHALIRSVSGIDDPYAEIKAATNRVCLHFQQSLGKNVPLSSYPLEAAVKISIGGNVIDFGRFHAIEMTRQDVSRIIHDITVRPLIGDPILDFDKLTQCATHILFLADNAGECFFDRSLIETIGPEKITYAVRGKPVINDATRKDAEAAGINNICSVIDTGDDAPGVLLNRVSTEFRNIFERSDVVISKGQGNYESLSNVTHKPIVFLTMVKCAVIARDIGHSVGSSVIKIQQSAPDRA
jgi:damage-control phosphatase, subfamily I